MSTPATQRPIEQSISSNSTQGDTPKVGNLPQLPIIHFDHDSTDSLSFQTRRQSFVSKSMPSLKKGLKNPIVDRFVNASEENPEEDEALKSPRQETPRRDVTSTSSRRRKSVLESTMMEGFDAEKMIAKKDHSIGGILDSHLEDFLKIVQIITEREQGLDSLSNDGFALQKLVSIAKGDVNGDTNRDTQDFIPENESMETESPRKPKSSRKRCNLRDLNQALLDAMETINAQEEPTDETEKLYIRQVQKIVNERETQILHWKKVKDQISQAQNQALNEERQKQADALQGFNFKIEGSLMPQVRVLLKLDNIEFHKYGLLSNPLEDKEEEEVPLDQKIRDQLNKIRNHAIVRTDSRTKKEWFIDQNSRMISVETPGVLETDAGQIQNPNGALEVPKHGRIRTNIHYPPDALKILDRMNTRINFLRNPRFTLDPIDIPKSHVLDVLDVNNSNNTMVNTGKLLSKTSHYD